MNRLFFLIFVILLTAACSISESEVQTPTSPSTAEPEPALALPTESVPTATIAPTSTPANPVGILTLEKNNVLHGQDENALVQLIESESFFEKDYVQAKDGGEAILDFSNEMRLRLFNDTELEIVASESASDVPLGVQVFLFLGGFTGQLSQEGGRAVFKTPGNVEITILGTDYFIVYDPQSEETIIGNFGGMVEVESAETRLVLEDNFYVIVPSGEAPDLVLPLPLSMEAFELIARDASSPIEAANLAKVWTLEMRHEFNVEVEDSIATLLREWTGQFTVEGEIIEGSGTGIVKDLNVTCPNPERTKFDIEGTFDFDINGTLEYIDDTTPIFNIDIVARNLEMTQSIDLSSCNGFIAAVQGINRDIIEEMPLLNTDTIIITAMSGANTEIELDGAPTGNENSIYYTNPIDVSISAIQH